MVGNMPCMIVGYLGPQGMGGGCGGHVQLIVCVAGDRLATCSCSS